MFRSGIVYTKNWERTYEYDTGGNITSAITRINNNGVLQNTIYENTYTYDSAWKDLLVKYNGNSITYDQIGNPIRYYDNSYLTWEQGRKLASINKNGGMIYYKYNEDGLRTSKGFNHPVNGISSTQYIYADGILTAQITGNEQLYFRYDSNDDLLAFEYNNGSTTQTYYYVKNLQGDIIGILNGSGIEVVTYKYDAWGKVTIAGSMASTIGTINPFRYRSYYYDMETGFYYLQSRYYDPVTSRYLNADVLETMLLDQNDLLSTNLFAYCANNPVNNVDYNGMFWSRVIIAAASGAIFGGIAYAIGRALKISGKPLAIFVALGVIIGAWRGVQILTSINQLIKPVIYFFSNPGKVYFGLKLLNFIQFEIHNPHHNKPIHFVIRLFWGGNKNFGIGGLGNDEN